MHCFLHKNVQVSKTTPINLNFSNGLFQNLNLFFFTLCQSGVLPLIFFLVLIFSKCLIFVIYVFDVLLSMYTPDVPRLLINTIPLFIPQKKNLSKREVLAFLIK